MLLQIFITIIQKISKFLHKKDSALSAFTLKNLIYKEYVIDMKLYYYITQLQKSIEYAFNFHKHGFTFHKTIQFESIYIFSCLL